MSKNKNLLILAGDGIGPEVMRQVARVLDWFAKRRRTPQGKAEEHRRHRGEFEACGTMLMWTN